MFMIKRIMWKFNEWTALCIISKETERKGKIYLMSILSSYHIIQLRSPYFQGYRAKACHLWWIKCFPCFRLPGVSEENQWVRGWGKIRYGGSKLWPEYVFSSVQFDIQYMLFFHLLIQSRSSAWSFALYCTIYSGVGNNWKLCCSPVLFSYIFNVKKCKNLKCKIS